MRTWFLSLLGYMITAFSLYASPLPAKEVFHANVTAIDPNTFAINFQIKPNYFLYSDRIKLTPESNNSIHLGTLRLPKTEKKIDIKGRIYTIYRNKITIPVGVLGNQPGKTFLELQYQGCSEDGFCYAPETKTIGLTIDNHLALSNVTLEHSDNPFDAPEKTQSDTLSELFMNHNWLKTLLVFYGLGLLLSFTPCILPMVPVLSGIIVGHGKEMTTQKAFLLSLSYVLSMSITYSIVGGIIALLGENLQISMQSPWSIGVFSFIFVLLALSMFGLYELKLPHSWHAKLHGTSSNQHTGHYLGAALMGCLSTLILSPCITAPLIGVLTYIAQTGNVLLGCLTLFILSLGMGTPLLLIGTSAGKWLPKSGSWMNAIKVLFGILFIAITIHLLSRIVPPLVSMLLWASLLVFSGIYSGAFTYSVRYRDKFAQGIGLIVLAYGFLILIGAGMGATNPLHPLNRPQIVKTATTKQESEHTLSTIEHALVNEHNKPIMLDFYADWCTSCKIMEETTFKDPRVQEQLTRFTVIKVDITQNNTENKAILNHFQVVAPPTFLFFNSKGQELPNLKLVGEISAEKLLMTLRVCSNHIDNPTQ